uniref:Putative rna-binding protein hnrnp-m n=1 Tax=Ixodes ricinus TaxID=34613 RepID=A0A0K8R8T3_IXORI
MNYTWQNRAGPLQGRRHRALHRRQRTRHGGGPLQFGAGCPEGRRHDERHPHREPPDRGPALLILFLSPSGRLHHPPRHLPVPSLHLPGCRHATGSIVVVQRTARSPHCGCTRLFSVLRDLLFSGICCVLFYRRYFAPVQRVPSNWCGVHSASGISGLIQRTSGFLVFFFVFVLVWDDLLGFLVCT